MKTDAPVAVTVHPQTKAVSELNAASLPSGSVAVVASRYHAQIVENLIGGAVDEIRKAGVPAESIHLLRVPGAFEIPQTVAQVLSKMPDLIAVVTLGCVVRGETPHFDYVCGCCADGVAALARSQPVPVTLGVLTADTLAQAEARSADDSHNKGREAAASALELAALLAGLEAH
ncbi:MAG: 6,7-dimethyl-8-ribityllumazine synthase [Pseudomonadota bacterium]